MANVNNNSTTTIPVPVLRKNNMVDVKAFLATAEKMAREFAETDASATQAVASVTEKILSDEKYADRKVFTGTVLARMVVTALDEVPEEKLCDETEERVKAFLSSQPEKYLHIKAGRNSGFHIISRYDAEELAKLKKQTGEASAK